jgi:hypothetical protein
MNDPIFINAIQSRLDDGEGFYVKGDTAIWLNNSLIDGSYIDIHCPLSLVETLDYDASLNYGDMPEGIDS